MTMLIKSIYKLNNDQLKSARITSRFQ